MFRTTLHSSHVPYLFVPRCNCGSMFGSASRDDSTLPISLISTFPLFSWSSRPSTLLLVLSPDSGSAVAINSSTTQVSDPLSSKRSSCPFCLEKEDNYRNIDDHSNRLRETSRFAAQRTGLIYSVSRWILLASKPPSRIEGKYSLASRGCIIV
jgi:hypothetical protein